MRASVFAVIGALTLVMTITGAVYFSIGVGHAPLSLSRMISNGLPGSIMAFGLGFYVSLFMLVTGGLIAGITSEGPSAPGRAWRAGVVVTTGVAVVALAVVTIISLEVDPILHERAGLVFATAQVSWILLILTALFRIARTPFEQRLWAARVMVVLVGVGPACLFVANLFVPLLDPAEAQWLQLAAMGVGPAFMLSLIPELQRVRVVLKPRR